MRNEFGVMVWAHHPSPIEAPHSLQYVTTQSMRNTIRACDADEANIRAKTFVPINCAYFIKHTSMK